MADYVAHLLPRAGSLLAWKSDSGFRGILYYRNKRRWWVFYDDGRDESYPFEILVSNIIYAGFISIEVW